MLAVVYGGVERVEVRRFGSPELRVLHLERGGSVGGSLFLRNGVRGSAFSHRGPVCVLQCETYVGAAREVEFHTQRSRVVCRVESGRQLQIVEAHIGRLGEEIRVACQSGETYEILVLHIRAVAPAQEFHADEVLLAGAEEICHVELLFQFAVLAVAYELAVHPEIHARRGATDVEHCAFALPCAGHVNPPAVGADVVLVLRHEGRCVFRPRTPCVAGARVDRLSEAVELPHARHGHGGPLRVVEGGGYEVGVVEIQLVVVDALFEAELPRAVEREVIGRKGGGVLLRLGMGAEGEEVGMNGQTVHGIDVGVLPFVPGLRRCG